MNFRDIYKLLTKHRCQNPAITNDIENTFEYNPASTESYLIDNMKNLHLDEDDPEKIESIKGCAVWKDPTVAPEIFDDLTLFRKEIVAYHEKVDEMKPVPDILQPIRKYNDHSVCKSTRLHPNGLPGIFPSKQLSHGNAGYAEPLLTPMRHPDFCFHPYKSVLDMKYLVLDFEKMCMDLKPYSRTVLIDIGASLSFHEENEPPIIFLLDMFKKFGFRFDHIYGIESTFEEPSEVFNNLLPTEYFDSYHWINTGVNATEGHNMNPLDSILRKFTPDDLVIVKLDIDTSSIEVPLAKQLLNDKSLHKIVDHFFFEQHVPMNEISEWWGEDVDGSVKSSFDLFRGLRDAGVMSHFWV